MTDVEKLARDICWVGFHNPPKGGKNKYWKQIAPGARESYIKTAKEFVWLAGRLGEDRVLAIVSNRVPNNGKGSAEAA